MTNKSKFILGILGSLLASSAIGIPLFITQSKKKKVNQQEQKILSKDQEQLKIITMDDIKEIDNVGLQYSTNAQTKELHLINPSWVDSVKLDKTKLSNFQKKKFVYSIKSNSLLVDDVTGSVSYVAIIKLNNAMREITILYENMNRISELGSFANWKKHLKAPINILNMQFYFNKLIEETKGDLSSKDLTSLNFEGVDVSQVTKWPQDLSGTKWKGVKKLTQVNTPFQEDLSKTKLTNIIFEKVDVTWVKKWPKDLSYVNWQNVIGLTKDNTPFKGNAYGLNIQGSILNGVDVSGVSIWPDNLSYIDWFAVQGLTSKNTPFKGDLVGFDLKHSKLKGVDVSRVIKWPSEKKVKAINFAGVLVTSDKRDNKPTLWDTLIWQKIKSGNDAIANDILNVITSFDIKVIDNVGLQYAPDAKTKNLNWINPSWVTNIEFEPKKFTILNKRSLEYLLKPDSLKVNDKNGTITYTTIVKFGEFKREISVSYSGLTRKSDNPFKSSSTSSLKERQYAINTYAKDNDGDFSTVDISDNKLANLDFSRIKKWPSHLSKVDWTGIKGLTKQNTPFKGDISNYFIPHSILNGIDVSEVVEWPENLSDVNWEKVVGLETSTPFKGDISGYRLEGLKGTQFAIIDVSKVKKWPKNLRKIDWTYIKGLTIDNTPFKGDISGKNIQNSILSGVDVSAVTKWFDVNAKTSIKDFITSINFGSVVISWDPTKDKHELWHKDIWDKIRGDRNVDASIAAATAIKDILSTIKPEQMKELDNVGKQYRTWKEGMEKKFNLINPSWITTDWIESTNLKLKSIKNIIDNKMYSKHIELKVTSLVTDDALGTITYVVSAKLISQVKEIKVIYSGLTKKYEENIFASDYVQKKDSKATLWDPIKQMQYYINQETKEHNGDISRLDMTNTDFAHLDVSQVTKLTNKLASTKWANIIGLTQANTPFQEDSSALQIANSQLAGLDLGKVSKWPNNLHKVDFTGAKNVKFTGDFALKNITYTKLNGVDVGGMTKWPMRYDPKTSVESDWPINIEGVNFTGVKNFNTTYLNFLFPQKWNLKNAVLKDAKIFVPKKPQNFISNRHFISNRLQEPIEWPEDLSGINWSGFKGLTYLNNPFKGDISNFKIQNSSFDGVSMFVDKWPKNLSGINWKGVIFENYHPYFKSMTPSIKGGFPKVNEDYENWIKYNIYSNQDLPYKVYIPNDGFSTIKFLDYKKFMKIPYLFKGDLSKYKMDGSTFAGIDLTQVTEFPIEMQGTNWKDAKIDDLQLRLKSTMNLSKSKLAGFKLPTNFLEFPGSLSGFKNKKIFGVKFQDVHVEDNMRKNYWPKDLSYIDWTGIKNLNQNNTPFKDDIYSYNIYWSNLKGVDVSKVTTWPEDLSGINWEGVIGLTEANTPFSGELNDTQIYGSILKGVDVSKVTKWPTNLSGINWEGVIGLTSANTPFKGDISSYSIDLKIQKQIIDSHMILLAKRFTSLKGIDISLVTEWPKKFAGINWKETTGSENKPNANNRNNKNDVDIQLIQDILNAKDADAKIVLSSNTRGNIIANNEQKILKKLRKMITGDETGAANHNSMKGVAISVSMGTDSPITTTAQEIIVTLRKGDGTPITISKFQVKREFTTTGVK